MWRRILIMTSLIRFLLRIYMSIYTDVYVQTSTTKVCDTLYPHFSNAVTCNGNSYIFYNMYTRTVTIVL